ncbi:pro-sigmaK processing inhibitor BofA family protein [Paenibacillus pinihumi]|uniref:pro-sigmaK processing inhibitor BofA family protein n=1 Tax=Paenibacillus pinihumi TaxID=669462 RepID=UPI0003FD3FD2|nr:pro-sigmaK processing inhibitor BofA family protein [Paenibacillus pinihumi]
MKSVWLTLLIGSLALLVLVFIKSKLSWLTVKRFFLHLVAAALLLYVLNFSGWISGFHIPLNPMTIAAVVILGVPGILLILALQWLLL